MDLLDGVRSRRMTRRFRPDPLDGHIVLDILSLAREAPSAGHAQGVDLLVLTDETDRCDFWAATCGERPAGAWLDGVRPAPLLVLVCAHPGAYARRYARPDKAGTDGAHGRWPTPWWDTDAAMTAMLLLLGAHAHGLGALWCGIPAGTHDAVRERCAIPADRRLVGLVVLGYGADRARALRPRPRRPLADVVHHGRWGTRVTPFPADGADDPSG